MCIVFSISLILLSLFLTSLVNVFCEINILIVNFWVLGFKTLKASTCFFRCSSVAFIYFSNAIPNGDYAYLGCLLFYFDLMVVFIYL